jgi:hypothetical protein
MRFKLRGVSAKLAAAAAVAYGGLALFGVPAYAAGVNSGYAQITDPATNKFLPTGGSTTNWTITFGKPVFCSGDTASKGYHVFGYIVPSNVDPGTLTFNAASGPSQGFPLVDNVGSPYIAANTAAQTGQVVQVPTFNWAAFSIDGRSATQILPAGVYHVGIACADTLGNGDKYWDELQTFTASTTDPAGERWTASPPPAIPESPLTIALPLSAVAIMGGGVVVMRRRHSRGAPVAV